MHPHLQYNLFETAEDTRSHQPDIRLVPDLVTNHAQWFTYLAGNVNWKTGMKSRKYATFGVTYNYNKGIRRDGEIPAWLKPLCTKVEKCFGFMPNNCLINNYPDGNHYISYHSDQDTEMKAQTGVAIVSLGAVRKMSLRRIDNHNIRFDYPLSSGSAFFMEDALQSEWQHGVLKQAGCGQRISLSFRSLVS